MSVSIRIVQLSGVANLFQSGMLVVLSSPFSMLSTTQNISNLFYQNMNKELDTWQRDTQELLENQVLFL